MNKRIAKISSALPLLAFTWYPLTTSAVDFNSLPILYDPDGSGGANSAVPVGAFQWAQASILSTSNKDQDETVDLPVIPWPSNTTKSIQTVSHGYFDGYSSSSGAGLPDPIGLNSTFETTFTLSYGEIGTSNSDVSQILFPGVPGITGVDHDSRFLNVVRIYYDNVIDDGTKADPLEGTGFSDGHPILTGVVVEAGGNFVRQPNSGTDQFDQFTGDNWGIDTILGRGSQQTFILVTEVDNNFFKDLNTGSLVSFDSNQTVPFAQTNPSKKLFSDTTMFTAWERLGAVNGQDGPDFELQSDPTTSFNPLELELSCRMTGGGNDTDGIYVDPTTGERIGWDGTEVSGSHTVTETIVTVKGKSGKVTTEEVTSTNVYTFGGQAGASTNGAKDGQPKGEREHVNHSGPAGQWSFHMGTASAPPGTEINKIVCSDEGWCRQARPAPTKQIDFDGIGSFRNIIDIGNLNDLYGDTICASVAETTGKPSERSRGTYNWAEFHIEDRGEPGKEGQHTTADPALCPANGTGTDAFDNYFGAPVFNDFTCLADGGPDCPDFYRIRIYCGVEPEFDSNGDLSNFAAIEAQKYNQPIYEVFGYIDGGNFQIHPPTGFDLK